MTKEEILAKAKKDYPVGTEFICVKNKTTKIRHSSEYGEKGFYCNDGNQLLGMVSPSMGAWVYRNGEWATITKSITLKQLPIFN